MLEYIDKSRVHCNKSLVNLNSYRLGGSARYVLYLHNHEVKRVVEDIKDIMPYVVLGLGCNVLVSDSGYEGAVIRLVDDNIHRHEDGLIVDAGANLAVVLQYACQCGLSGLEWATGLPSTVGGAIFGNAGARGKCIADSLMSCQILHKSGIIQLTHRQCNFAYRYSVLQDMDAIVLQASFGLTQSTVDIVRSNMNVIRQLRNNIRGLCAGSVFKNSTQQAGKLIDDCGLKGTKIGGAMVSQLHANWIINDGTATATDVYNLIQLVQSRVLDIHGIQLQLELRLIGEF
ncbi:MAG: UDP-N-acetylmuramate dehydrogenase [Clostridiales bacterium]|nr:UDP-N-acetylmuramate dehydrogenase [Clostridiales bacterium]